MAIFIFNVPARTMKRERFALAGRQLLTSFPLLLRPLPSPSPPSVQSAMHHRLFNNLVFDGRALTGGPDILGIHNTAGYRYIKRGLW